MAAAPATMVSQVPEDTRKMIARTATAVAATAQLRQITDAQVTAVSRWQFSRRRVSGLLPRTQRTTGPAGPTGAQGPMGPRGCPGAQVLPDQLVPWGLRLCRPTGPMGPTGPAGQAGAVGLRPCRFHRPYGSRRNYGSDRSHRPYRSCW